MYIGTDSLKQPEDSFGTNLEPFLRLIRKNLTVLGDFNCRDAFRSLSTSGNLSGFPISPNARKTKT